MKERERAGYWARMGESSTAWKAVVCVPERVYLENLCVNCILILKWILSIIVCLFVCLMHFRIGTISRLLWI
jgi:hypothetical protein